ncbi:MAG: hypothetical protein HOP19_26530, partial [Acidobacteria bacterium]|nr:hypothetical protein [Acidobacteriota bacterium]
WEIIRWLFSATEVPNQQDVPGNFGNPPITLFAGPRFHIDVYFWLDGTTSIHQHAFCGAFQVLMGSSIHSHYRFHPRQTLNQHFMVGEFELASVELLERGQVREILPGKEYIHSLFHLDRPSATICVRTYHTASGSPQYNFLKPHFATDPFFKEALSIKQLQSAALLLKMEHPDTLAMLDELLSHADFQTAFSLIDLAKSHLSGKALENVFGLTTGEEQYQHLLATARRRHGALVDLIPDVFEEARRQNNLTHRRGQITGAEHRFFLALLLNVPNRQRVLEMIAQRFPQTDPLDQIAEWVESLAHTKVWGSSEPNVLGIENYDDDYALVLRCLFQGMTFAQTLEAFATETSAEEAAEFRDELESLYSTIRNSMIFKAALQY